MNRFTPTFFVLLIVCVSAPSLSAQSFLKFSEPGWDFGKREQTEQDKYVIKITNSGPRVVQIKKLELTCGCVKAEVSKKVIGAGETVDLNLTLFANRGEGDIRKFAIVHSDDPGQPKKKLFLKGHIRPIWQLDVKGRMLDFGDVKNGENATRRVTLTVRPEYKVKLVDVLCQPTGGLVKIKQTSFKKKDGHYGWYFDITLTEKVSNGDFEGIVRVETDFAKFRFRGFRLKARVHSTTEVSPKTLRCGTIKAGSSWQGEVIVTKTMGQGLTITNVTCEDPRVKLKTEVIEAGKKHRVRVTITPQSGDSEVRGTIKITVSEPGWAEFKVKFRGRVQQG